MSTPSTRKYRSRSGAPYLIAFSASFEKEALIRRGLGIEHLRELLLGLARPVLRAGASVSYGGNWQDVPENFTYDLLRLISAEREDSSFAADTTPIGWLYNLLAWPHYLLVTPWIEAQWIHCCRIVRITQELAGIPATERLSERLGSYGDQQMLNSAITLSAMRRFAAEGMTVGYTDVPASASLVVPQQSARILLGGKISGYSGFTPGLFEEALIALERKTPLFVLGGFGGAASAISEALLAAPGQRPAELSLQWQQAHTPLVSELTTLIANRTSIAGVRTPQQFLDDLYAKIEAARGSLSASLNTGLTDDETRELMTTLELRRALQLTLKGLENVLTGVKLSPS